MHRIKLLHLVDTLGIGGMENGVVNLANCHDSNLFEYSICCFSHRGPLSERIIRRDVELYELGYGPGLQIPAVFSLARLLKRLKIEIVHTQGWGAKSLYGIVASKLAGVPIIINGEHGALYSDSWLKRSVQRLLSRMCDGILSVSESLKQRLAMELGVDPARVHVIPNGVDLDIFNGDQVGCDLPEELKAESERFTFGVIGSLKPKKNQKVVIAALALMKRAGVKARLLLIGDGPDREFLTCLVNSFDLTQEVTFMGIRNDVPALLSIVNALVLPSAPDHEGMSNVILEAFASRVPVLTTAAVGSNELVEDGRSGIVFRWDDPVDLAQKMIRLIEDAGFRKRIIDRAYRRVSERHALTVMVGSYQDYYIQAMDNADRTKQCAALSA